MMEEEEAFGRGLKGRIEKKNLKKESEFHSIP